MKKKTNQLFKAFADENRLRILHLLTEGELCVCDITESLQMPQSKASRHLGYLRSSGLVSTRRDGKWIYYTLSNPVGEVHRRLLNCLHGCLEEIPTLKSDAANLKRISQKKCC
jgi:ArsR family transcriptional regulator